MVKFALKKIHLVKRSSQKLVDLKNQVSEKGVWHPIKDVFAVKDEATQMFYTLATVKYNWNGKKEIKSLKNVHANIDITRVNVIGIK